MPRARSGRVTPLPDFGFNVVSKPSLMQIRQDILTLEDNMGDWIRPMQLSKQMLIDDTKRAFYNEVDPREGDKPWAPWSYDYAKRVKHGSKLRRSGKLFRSVTNPNNWRVNVKPGFGDIQLNTYSLPFYWTPHQFGHPPGYTGSAQQRVKIINRFDQLSKGDSYKYAKLAKKNPLIPKRGFIGGGPAVQGAIFNVFDKWAENTIRIDKWRNTRGNIRLTMRNV